MSCKNLQEWLLFSLIEILFSSIYCANWHANQFDIDIGLKIYMQWNQYRFYKSYLIIASCLFFLNLITLYDKNNFSYSNLEMHCCEYRNNCMNLLKHIQINGLK